MLSFAKVEHHHRSPRGTLMRATQEISKRERGDELPVQLVERVLEEQL